MLTLLLHYESIMYRSMAKQRSDGSNEHARRSESEADDR